MKRGYNMAEWPDAERLAVNADLVATQIRQTTRGMALGERRRYAAEKLDRMPASERERVLAAMKERAREQG